MLTGEEIGIGKRETESEDERKGEGKRLEETC